MQAEERVLMLPVAARTTHLGPLREELDAEERVDKDKDQPNELKRKRSNGSEDSEQVEGNTHSNCSRK